ncbi:nidogen-2-like isoform X2 [Macrobrachium rosenbergii]|uniref:nidogen-2-like isoform X2 n=1 Tax=Macrobrachium rosenbergii TaxID=79674 RepID=UPI0034D527B1
MVTTVILVTFLLAAGNFAHCQDWENLLFIKMEEVLQKQEAALNQLKKQEAALKDMQEKLEHIENNLQELHHEMEHLKGAATDNQDSLQRIHQEAKHCLGREDLESFKNISSAGQQELESSLRQEISGVISLLETGGIDECSEGSHNCGDHEACTDKFVNFTCSCVPGFARNGSRCEDMDECARGKAECSPHAACRNSVGSYSCSCNPPFEGDGRTCSCPPGFAQNGSNCDDMDECARGKAECSPHAACRNSVGSYSCSCNPPFKGDGRTCEFSCKSPAKVIEGLGCVKHVEEWKTWQGMEATCQEAGWRLLQDFSVTVLQEVVRAFPYAGWTGVYEGKWLESGIPLLNEIWMESYQGADPSRTCGLIYWDSSSSLNKVAQTDCSVKGQGFCQVQLLS